jgi:O-antigen/teichoic acid export membrane protein
MLSILVARDLLRKVGGSAALKGSSLLLGFLISILLARTMGPEEFGRYVFAFSVISLAALPVGTALNQFVMRESARAFSLESPALIKGLIKRSYVWVSSIGLLVCGSLWWWVSARSDDTAFIWGLPIIPLMALVAVRTELLRGAGLILQSQWPDMVLRPLCFVVLACVLMITNALTAVTVLVAYGAALIITLLIVVRLFHSSIATEKYRETPAEFDDGRWLKSMPWFMAISAIGASSTLSGAIILGLVNTDVSQVAAFQLGLSFSALVGLPLVIVNLVVGPQITQWWEAGDRDACVALISQMTRLAAGVSVVGGALVLYLPEIILGAFYGDAYEYGVKTLQVLVVSQMVNVAFGPVGLALTLSGFERQAFTGQLAGLLVSVSITVLLVGRWGAVGAAVGAFAGLLVWNIWMAYQVRRHWEGPFLFLASGVVRDR